MIKLPLPGTKVQSLIDVAGLPGLPVTFIAGGNSGPTVLVVAGVHGGEYGAILALVELAWELTPPMVYGRLLMIHPVNPQGFYERRATVLPEDGKNINSQFYNHEYKGPAAEIAAIVADLQSSADFYLDLHTADLFEATSPLACYPATGNETVTNASRRAALMVNAPLIIKSSMPGAGITEAARRGLPALLIKRGGAGGTCRRPEVDLYKKDVLNVLRHLGSLAGEPVVPLNPPREIVPAYLRSNHQGLWLPAALAGQAVLAGQPLGRLTDFFGNNLESCCAEKDGTILYGLQALSANPGDILMVY